MKKYLFTFGVGTYLKGKCITVVAENEDVAREYVFDKYGQMNVSSVRDFNTSCYLIEKYNYEIIEEANL